MATQHIFCSFAAAVQNGLGKQISEQSLIFTTFQFLCF